MRRYASLGIQFSRGCPYNCDFCNVTALFGHRPRTKTAAQIIAELDSLYALGWRGGVFFVDDNLIGNKKELKTELLPALIETPDEDSLAECSKNQNKNRDLVENVKRIQQAGLQVQAGFIVGFDSDKPSIFQRQIDFIQQCGIATAMVGLLQAPPGTKLYERLKQEGRLVEEMSGDNVDGTTNIIPAMNLDTLREGYKNVMNHIYSPGPYYQRVKTFLREYKAPKVTHKLDIQYILAFFRSVFRLGIIGKERFHYWKLVIWTLFRRPNLFPLAIELSIYGHHFRKVCELHVV